MKRITGVPLCLLLAVVAMVWAAPCLSLAAEEERILSYDSHIAVLADGTMTVRETIKARARGDKIKRGIYRDFPTLYRDHYGNRYRVVFEVLEVLRDGKADAYHIESLKNGQRVYIGKKDVYLNPGDYTYTLVYRTNRQLGFFADHDELYWNVTGNGWDFLIERAAATVELPAGVPREQIKVDGFTGLQGLTGKEFRASVDRTGKSGFTTTRALGPKEGLTIVVSWPKGVVAEPTKDMKFRYFLSDNGSALAGGLGLAIVLGYYLIWWRLVGKDPEPGTIIPLYEPPAGFSPAAARYLKEMGYDHQVFTAAVINMAVKGYVTISEEGGVYTITRGKGNAEDLAPEEKQAADKLLGSASSIELKDTNHETVSAAIKALKSALKLHFEKTYFLTNTRYFVIGLLLSLAAVAATVLADPAGTSPDTLFLCLWLTIWTGAVTFMVGWMVIPRWKNFAATRIKRVRAFFTALGGTLFALPFIAAEIGALAFLAYSTSILVLAALVLIAVLNVLFYHLLKAPTRAGRQLLDKIDGFKQYLAIAEKDRLNLLNPPERTPSLFEKYLPYALALGVQQEWAEQFAGVLAQAGAAGQAYSPDWYSGSSFDHMGTSSFADSLGSSFTSAVSSSSTAPGSSSGDGGSSGGGGGGGGGGGW
jgi:hypothetical protein